MVAGSCVLCLVVVLVSASVTQTLGCVRTAACIEIVLPRRSAATFPCVGSAVVHEEAQTLAGPSTRVGAGGQGQQACWVGAEPKQRAGCRHYLALLHVALAPRRALTKGAIDIHQTWISLRKSAARPASKSSAPLRARVPTGGCVPNNRATPTPTYPLTELLLAPYHEHR